MIGISRLASWPVSSVSVFEIRLAKTIEVTRRRFRTKLLECDYVIQIAYKILRRVHTGELPFDRTVQVSVTDRLEKEQILGRLPHNLKTLAEKDSDTIGKKFMATKRHAIEVHYHPFVAELKKAMPKNAPEWRN